MDTQTPRKARTVNHAYAQPDHDPMAGADILTEAHHLITGPRQAAYSHPHDDYTKVRNIYQAMTGISLTVEQAILFMVAVKLARLNTTLQHGRLHHDSLVDTAGYLGCLNMAHQHRLHHTPEPFRDEQ
jgi:hypothetical protein